MAVNASNSRDGLPTPSLALLRDLPFRIALGPSLEKQVLSVFDELPSASAEPEIHRHWIRRVIEVTGSVVSYVEAECVRLERELAAAPDMMALRQEAQRPRADVAKLLAELRNKVGTEKNDAMRRFTKQAGDIHDQFAARLKTLRASQANQGDWVEVAVEVEWIGEFRSWHDQAMSKWAQHTAALARDRLLAACRDELAGLRRVLGSDFLSATDMPPAASLGTLGSTETHRFEMPTPVESFFESFKGGLNTVAMLAGMVIVPVVGNFTQESGPGLRAAVMSGFLAPVVLFALVETGKQRTKLLGKHLEKAIERLRGELDGLHKKRVERFKHEVERIGQAYLTSFMDQVSVEATRRVELQVKQREDLLQRDTADQRLESTRIQEQLALYRNAKSGLKTQVEVDLKRRLRELS